MPRPAAVPQCPVCSGSPAAVRLVFGLPSAEAFEAAERGELVLAGFEFPETGPPRRWACSHCQRRLG